VNILSFVRFTTRLEMRLGFESCMLSIVFQNSLWIGKNEDELRFMYCFINNKFMGSMYEGWPESKGCLRIALSY
jgi:hypothetical protein